MISSKAVFSYKSNTNNSLYIVYIVYKVFLFMSMKTILRNVMSSMQSSMAIYSVSAKAIFVFPKKRKFCRRSNSAISQKKEFSLYGKQHLVTSETAKSLERVSSRSPFWNFYYWHQGRLSFVSLNHVRSQVRVES